MTFIGVISLLLAIIFLIATLLSFPAKPHFPKPDAGRFTGYPIWRFDIKGFDPEVLDTILFLTNSLGLVVSILVLYWTLFSRSTRNTITYFRSGSVSTPNTLFNATIALFLAITNFAGFTFEIFDLGKLWTGQGLLHNMFELVLTYILLNGGKVDLPVLFWMTTIYSTVVVAGVSILKYPYDLSFFKIQGLALDYALTMMIIIMVYKTVKSYRDGYHQLINQSASEDEVGVTEEGVTLSTSVEHPGQIWYLLIAIALHLIGNVVYTSDPLNTISFIVFLISYINLFQFMGYYIYVETHDHTLSTSKRFYLPKTSLLTIINISVWSFALSLLTNRIGLESLNQIQDGISH